MTSRIAVAAAAAIGFLAAALASAVFGTPPAQIHDEAAYLLQADTFTHVRLTNPPHSMWRHFETFYVLQRPTYQAKYQPGQAALLAIGQLLGCPIVGAWIAAALACGAVTWMALAWLPLPWAIAAGAIAALHPTMLAWSHSYWGGALAVTGSALVIGASRRLIERFRLTDSLLLGTGILIIVNSRPFEGGVLLIALLIAATVLRALRWNAIAPAAVVVVVGLLFNAYYDFRVTGHPLRLPYVEYEHQYAVIPALIVQRLQPIRLPHADMRRLAEDWLAQYRAQHSVAGFARAIPRKIALFANAAFPVIPEALLVRVRDPGLTLVLSTVAILIEFALLLPFVWLPRDRYLGAAVVVFVISCVIALTPIVVPLPHYAAPLVPLLLLLWLVSVRAMPRRRAFVLFAIVVAITGLVLWRDPIRWPEVQQRLNMEREIEKTAGAHLVLVRYTPAHQVAFSWIQNRASIDAQRIVWARDLDDNTALLRYYASRTVWLIIAGDPQPRLILLRRRGQQTLAESQAAPAIVPKN